MTDTMGRMGMRSADSGYASNRRLFKNNRLGSRRNRTRMFDERMLDTRMLDTIMHANESNILDNDILESKNEVDEKKSDSYSNNDNNFFSKPRSNVKFNSKLTSIKDKQKLKEAVKNVMQVLMQVYPEHNPANVVYRQPIIAHLAGIIAETTDSNVTKTLKTIEEQGQTLMIALSFENSNFGVNTR